MEKEKAVKPVAGLIVSLLGGLIAIFSALAYEAFIVALGGEATPYGPLSFLAGILMIVGSIVGYRGRAKLGGWLVIVFSLANLVGLGILAFLPIIIGIIGGVLILIGK